MNVKKRLRARLYHWLELVAMWLFLQTRLFSRSQCADASPQGERLWRVLSRVFATSPEFVRWQSEIESLRHRLLNSSESLQVDDFGAGSKVVVSEDTRTIADICAHSSKSPIGGRLLFHLVREFQPENCLELGTSLGLSSAYIGAALAENGHGALLTLEGAEQLAEAAKRHLVALNLDRAQVISGGFEQTLAEALARNSPVDFAFIDGHHDGRATLVYFEQIVVASGDTLLMVLDDIRWSRSMRRAWRQIRRDSRVVASVDLWEMGIVVLRAGKA